MLVGTYHFSCRFDTDALLPRFKGSTLRGALGHALKKISCALRQQRCETCLLFSSCAYAYLFEVKKRRQQEASGYTAHRPHPYVLEPPDTQQRSYSAGESFVFTMSLFGRANEYLPHIVYGVEERGRGGLGKKASSLGKFRLETLHHEEDQIYSRNGTLTLPESLTEVCLEPAPSLPVDMLRISFETPLRLKQNNHLRKELPFHLLVRAALRRISSLEEAYGNGEPNLDYKGIAARAAAIGTGEQGCRWMEIERYSNRQKTAMSIGGLVGANTYRAENLAEFIPLLRYCETTHLGKQTSFGLGRIRVAAGEPV